MIRLVEKRGGHDRVSWDRVVESNVDTVILCYFRQKKKKNNAKQKRKQKGKLKERKKKHEQTTDDIRERSEIIVVCRQTA